MRGLSRDRNCVITSWYITAIKIARCTPKTATVTSFRGDCKVKIASARKRCPYCRLVVAMVDLKKAGEHIWGPLLHRSCAISVSPRNRCSYRDAFDVLKHAAVAGGRYSRFSACVPESMMRVALFHSLQSLCFLFLFFLVRLVVWQKNGTKKDQHCEDNRRAQPSGRHTVF